MAAPASIVGTGLRKCVIQQHQDDDEDHDAADDEDFVDLVGLFGKGLVETRRALAAFFQLIQAHAARHEHRGVHRLFHRSRRRAWSRSAGGCAFHFQLQFHLAEAQGLAGLEDAFLNFIPVDERAVGGVQVADENVAAAQMNFAVMAGNGRVGDLKGVVLDPADGGAVGVQFARASRHALILDNKFRHSYGQPIMVGLRFKSNGNLENKYYFFSISARNSANSGVESCGPGEASG